MAENAYLNALGYRNGENQSRLPPMTWMLSKVPAATGGMVANTVYALATERWFTQFVPQFGAEMVGSIALGGIAYVVDHSSLFDSTDLRKAFTDGLIGRGAPVLSNSVMSIITWIFNWLRGQGGQSGQTNNQKAQALLSDPGVQSMLPETNLDHAPQAVAEMLSLLSNSPRTREMIAQDLMGVMERRGFEITPEARSQVANCINDLAVQYKR